jgi:hypothetical protein
MQSRLLASTATLVGLLGAGFLSPNAAMQTAQAQTQMVVSSPTAGVICDPFGPTCYDRQGASVRYTQTYFGNNAANRLSSKLRNKALASDVMLSNGSLCDFRAATCWSDGWRKGQVSTQLSQQLFGWAPSPNPGYGNALQGLETPRVGVVCDQSTKTCYDQSGLSLALTRDYFGTYAEQTALRNLAGQMPPQQFRLSNGSSCDVSMRTCWSDTWSRQQVNAALTNQLFSGGGIGSNQPTDYQGSTVTRQAQCTISRWFQTLFRGSCELRETTNNLGRLLEVNLQDGSRYSISRPQTGNFQLTDPMGKIWPLQVRDQGQTVSFSWSDRTLSVSDQGTTNTGLSLGDLINRMMGQ